jgi:hypothetical protein
MAQDMYGLSRRACAQYALDLTDVPQQRFRYALNRYIMNGLPVPEAEAKAIASVRNTHPDFVPTRSQGRL